MMMMIAMTSFSCMVAVYVCMCVDVRSEEEKGVACSLTEGCREEVGDLSRREGIRWALE